MGYRLANVRNPGASGLGLSPSVPMAWQREQFAVTSAFPLLVTSRSAGKADAAVTSNDSSAASTLFHVPPELR
jgi:hypothetical protein